MSQDGIWGGLNKEERIAYMRSSRRNGANTHVPVADTDYGVQVVGLDANCDVCGESRTAATHDEATIIARRHADEHELVGGNYDADHYWSW